MKTRTMIFTGILAVLPLLAGAQEIQKTSSSFLSAGLLQLKEQGNHGLVFRGPSLAYGRRCEKQHNRFATTYEFDLGASLPFARSIAGINFHLKPVDLMVAYKFNLADVEFQVGPVFRLEYDVQFYPDLQSGYDFWLTEVSLGLGVRARVPMGPSLLELKVNNSVDGVVCRTPHRDDPYFFDLGFLAVLRDMHQNGRSISQGQFSSTHAEIHLIPSETSRISFAYCADLSTYRTEPQTGMLNQSIRIYFHPRYR